MNSLINNGRKFRNFVECRKCIKSFSSFCVKRNSIVSRINKLANRASSSSCSISSLRWLSTPDRLSSLFPSTDYVADDILSMKSCDDVLTYLGTSDPNTITCNHTWLAMNHIMQIHYKDLWRSNTWMHSNIHIAYIQLLLEQRVEECFKVYLDHPSFPKLHTFLLDQHMMLDSDKLSDALLSFVYMGMPFDDILIHKYLTRIHEEINSLSLRSLETLSNVVRSLPGFQYAIVRDSIRQVKSFMENNPSPTIDELNQLANIIINSIKFIDKDLSITTLEYFQKCLPNVDFSRDPEKISCILRMVQTFYQTQSSTRNQVYGLVNLLVKICSGNVQKFYGPSISEICRSLKLMRCYRDSFARLMVFRASELLDETSRVSEVSNLMSSLNQNSLNSTVKKFENHLYEKMSDSDSYFDAILISNIADSLLDLSKIDSKTLEVFHKLVAKQANNIVAYLSRFNRVSRLLAIHPFTDPEDEKNFVQIVAKYVDSIYGINLFTLSFMGVYLLSLNSHDCIPVHVYNRLISTLPNWNVPELSRLLGYLNIKVLKQPIEQRQHHMHFIRNLQQLIVSKLSDVHSLDSLFSTTVSVVVNSKLSNPSLTEYVMNCVIPFSENLDPVSAGKIAKLMSLTNYYMPDVSENLIKYVVENPEKMTNENVRIVLATCAKLGHRSAQMDKFCEVVREVYKDDLKEGNYKDCLLILNNFAMIQHFPEDLLQNFFSLETIENLERFIGDTGDRVAEHTLMNLNRSIILECPHLDIPWFNEQYCIDALSKTSHSRNRHRANMVDDVYQVLSQLFKGSHYARVDTLSRYYYRIDCELGLDSNSRPVPATILDSSIGNAVQRIAVCIWHEGSYCKHSRHLTGHERLRKRYLELLNYKIVEVPYHEWYSMGLSENSMKIKYLENKLKQIKI